MIWVLHSFCALALLQPQRWVKKPLLMYSCTRSWLNWSISSARYRLEAMGGYFKLCVWIMCHSSSPRLPGMLETNWRLISFLQYEKTAATAIANHTKRLKNTELPRSSDPTRIKVDLSGLVCNTFTVSSTGLRKSLLPTHCLHKWLLHRSNPLYKTV